MPGNNIKILAISLIFAILFISIPTGTYLLSQTLKPKTVPSSSQKKPAKTTTEVSNPTEVPKTNPLDDLKQNSANKLKADSGKASAPEEETGTEEPTSNEGEVEVSFGPTLDFKIILEGRPTSDQSTKLFLGISQGTNITSNPKYILSFTVNMPKSGEFKGVSLAGLESGNKYTAILKAPAQIATSSAFIATPTKTLLNEGNPLTLTTGDLNEDNLIDTTDVSIAQKAYGALPSSANWNANADLNLDQIINNFDVGIIQKNKGKIGATGAWYSKVSTASSSASLYHPIGPASGGQAPSQPISTGGYWIWVPGF